MAIQDDAYAWIAENGMGSALFAARQNNPPEVNLERFAASHPNDDYNVIARVFGVALAAIGAAGVASGVAKAGSGGINRPPVTPDVPSGVWRYRFTVRFSPRIGFPELRTAWRSDVQDYSHELSLEELDAIQLDLELKFRQMYGFTGEKYESDFIIESITKGP